MRRSRKSVFSEEKITVFFIGFYSLEAVGGIRKPCSKMGKNRSSIIAYVLYLCEFGT